jgi:ERCC4-related helicase
MHTAERVNTSTSTMPSSLLQVDLIICWDASSPSRMRQREGRTGRSRPGRVVYLLSEGREQQHYEDNHAKEQLVKVRRHKANLFCVLWCVNYMGNGLQQLCQQALG